MSEDYQELSTVLPSMLKNLIMKVLGKLPGPPVPVKVEPKEECIDVEIKFLTSAIPQVIKDMLNMKDTEDILLQMTVVKNMVHGDKLLNTSYDHLAIRYGVVREYMVNAYSKKPHRGRLVYAKKEKIGRRGNPIIHLSST